MHRIIFTCFIVLFAFAGIVKAQDSVVYRVILIGDAGEIDKQQMATLDFAASLIIKNHTTVLYLGDNVYPHGMGLPGSPDQARTENILRSEYGPMRAKGAPVYFVPGNHDWDKMGPHGLEKIKRQWEYIGQQQDSLLHVVPANGCPDPYEISINDKLTIIAYDSEWWLFPYNKSNPGADCGCQTRDDVVNRLRQLYYQNRDKIILLASHHPFQSYGVHGGVFSLKDHLFPLTAINKDLYIPLPVVGSLYPLLRTVFVNPEDMGHPKYKDMIKKIDSVFKGDPNLIHVAGHDHGLQFIKNSKGDVQVVSGAGAKQVYVKKGKNSLFADAVQGFVTADQLLDNSMRFTYYTYTENGIKAAFTYTKPYQSVAPLDAKTFESPAADSVTVSVHAAYDSVGNFHRKIFGENYRKEWAAKVKLPYIKLSELHGGLTPVKKGGGFQSQSLRMVAPDGKEWVLRTVEKDPTKLLPAELVQTFAFGLLDDATSAQHPFGALIVPPIADALHIPHANPVIGVVAPDKNLGQYANIFVNKVCLLEEREPSGKSDNTEKMEKALQKDNDNHFKAREFARARMLDVLIGDWDRHEDQWRWEDEKDGDGKMYTAVPRDRDQSLYTRQKIENIAALRWVLPPLQGFSSKISDVRYSMFKSRFMNAYPESKFSYAAWMEIAQQVQATVTDRVFEAALRRLPPEIYRIRHDELAEKFRKRRAALPAAMDEYYRFAHKIEDIRLSDKNEQVRLSDAPGNGLAVVVTKLSKKGKEENTLLTTTYHPDTTKEVRIFTADGDDQVIVDTRHTAINIRLVGGDGEKQYQVLASNHKIKLYGKTGNHTFTGDSTRFITHFTNDTATTAIHSTNLYNVWMPLATAGINPDDGFLLGLGFRYVGQQGFRTFPYATLQELMITHSFSTQAFALNYRGEWIKAVGNADFVLQTQIKAPDNTMNFFGRGNQTVYDRSKDFARYYRIRFNTIDINPALRWRTASASSLSIGPAVSYYHLDLDENAGRLINDAVAIGSYDSTSVNKDKLHAGIVMAYTSDKRDNALFPSSGIYIHIRLQGYAGLNSYSKSFAQIIPEIAMYTTIGAGSRLVLAERLGGGITAGQTAFYQSLFLGGQGNLLGYRQNRFAGQHSFYNNLELRLRLGDVSSYVLPGQFGLSGFYDIGRVWEKHQASGLWHQGVGGGVYFAPAALTVLQLQAGYSGEGWYPAFSVQFRY